MRTAVAIACAACLVVPLASQGARVAISLTPKAGDSLRYAIKENTTIAGTSKGGAPENLPPRTSLTLTMGGSDALTLVGEGPNDRGQATARLTFQEATVEMSADGSAPTKEDSLSLGLGRTAFTLVFGADGTLIDLSAPGWPSSSAETMRKTLAEVYRYVPDASLAVGETISQPAELGVPASLVPFGAYTVDGRVTLTLLSVEGAGADRVARLEQSFAVTLVQRPDPAAQQYRSVSLTVRGTRKMQVDVERHLLKAADMEATFDQTDTRQGDPPSPTTTMHGVMKATVSGTVETRERADIAWPRTDQNSLTAHHQLVAKAKQGTIGVYFVGDSIVRRWGALDYPALLANWKANFFGWNAANFGWGADKTQNMLWRLDHGELDGIHPKAIVILAGTNNVGAAPGDASKIGEVTSGVQAIVDRCRRKVPGATIVLTAIFPRNDNMAVMPEIARINENLARLADGDRVRFLDVNDRLADPSGRLLEGMMNADALHPTLRAYQIWADALKPILTELLGPPAAIDHAPPPTGDPSRAGAQR